jgi:hypothetical protein
MSLLEEQVKALEEDLLSDELKISPYHDLPFAIFRYDPELEFEMRKEINFLATRLKNKGKKVHVISLANIFFDAIEKEGGREQIIKEEKEFGFLMAQKSLNTILSDPDYYPIADTLKEKLENLDPGKDIVFLTRAGIFSPEIYKISILLDEMHGKTDIPIILFYPGKVTSQAGLRFMDLPKRETQGSYHVNIYNRNE